MNIKQKIISLAVILGMGVGIVAVTTPTALALKCGDTETSIIGGDVICDKVNNSSDKTEDNAIWKLLLFALQIMTAGVGVLAVAGIVYGSVLYTTASDKAEQTKKAITMITNVVIGILAYGMMYIGLNFLIPGGIFT